MIIVFRNNHTKILQITLLNLYCLQIYDVISLHSNDVILWYVRINVQLVDTEFIRI